eukprot:930067-Pyramimonas_sp.AAC.1
MSTHSKRLCPLAIAAFNRGANDRASSKRAPRIAFCDTTGQPASLGGALPHMAKAAVFPEV